MFSSPHAPRLRGEPAHNTFYTSPVPSLTIDPILAPGGPIARLMGEHFEPRPQQAQMAAAITRAMDSRSQLLVEAGTGIGKSFAYLVPAIRRIIEHNEIVVVATNTIALQEQLLSKDIPLLRDAFRGGETEPFRAELVKGRGNYLSLRRLQLASKRQDRLFPDDATMRSLHVIEDWAYATTEGSLSTLPPLERAGVWDRVQSDSGNCMGRKCPNFSKCFYQQARRRMESANLLICNHAIFFSDLALRTKDAGFLPKYDHVILDEAHNIEDVASEHFGVSLAEGRVRHLLSTLVHTGKQRAGRGFLPSLIVSGDSTALLERAAIAVHRAGSACDEFFDQIVELTGRRPGTARLAGAGRVNDTLSGTFKELALMLKRLKEGATNEEDKFELNAYSLRAAAIAEDVEALCTQSQSGFVYWAEVTKHESYGLRATLACSPVEVAPVLREKLFGGELSVTLTSATLTTGGTGGGSFHHAKSRLGCDDAAELTLGSPFDHAALVELHVDAAMPDPRSSEFDEELASRIRTHVLATDGGAFVLFTSFATMHRAAERLRDELESRGMPVFVQGRDGSRIAILERFRESERSVLFGTSSFWQGVDVRGRGLRNVIITRLPFDPPDRPLTQARLELIEARGGNPFMEDSLPRAVIRFKQGFGRLVRSATDSGRVVVLDPRLVKSRYGSLFLDAIPSGVRIVGADTDTEPDF